MANFVFKDNSAVVLRRIGTNSQAAMQSAADMLVEAVQEQILYGYHTPHGSPPHTEIVDTGRLFESITAEVKRDSQNAYSADVGTDVPYAIFVHGGTSKLEGRPFITDGTMKKLDDLKKLLSTGVSAGFGKK